MNLNPNLSPRSWTRCSVGCTRRWTLLHRWCSPAGWALQPTGFPPTSHPGSARPPASRPPQRCLSRQRSTRRCADIRGLPPWLPRRLSQPSSQRGADKRRPPPCLPAPAAACPSTWLSFAPRWAISKPLAPPPRRRRPRVVGVTAAARAAAAATARFWLTWMRSWSACACRSLGSRGRRRRRWGWSSRIAERGDCDRVFTRRKDRSSRYRMRAARSENERVLLPQPTIIPPMIER